jgi:hypothetical protein
MPPVFLEATDSVTLTNEPVRQELLALFEADRRERKNPPPHGTPKYHALRQRDVRRRERVRQIVAANTNLPAIALYYAALVLQHGGTVDEVCQAHQLAQHAAAMDYRPARWLTAAACDRWLMMQGRPQKYGTQIVPDGVGFRVWDADPATTDAERARWDVRPLAQQHARAAEMTRTDPLPPMDHAPTWLKTAIARRQKDTEP